MKKQAIALVALSILTCLTACSPIKTPVTNQYRLDAFSCEKLASKKAKSSILISQPESLAGYQTEQMLYVKKPYELSSYARNSWVSPPANMLYPLIMESLQKAGYFYAIASGPFVDKADYRLDTQLIKLQQNFLVKPSAMEMVVKVMLTHISDNRVIASRIIVQHVNCPKDSPYGGVIAANQASQKFTEVLSKFVVSSVERDRSRPKMRPDY